MLRTALFLSYTFFLLHLKSWDLKASKSSQDNVFLFSAILWFVVDIEGQ